LGDAATPSVLASETKLVRFLSCLRTRFEKL